VIPAPFEYARPRSLDEALELVAGADPSIRVLAGGQSLIPLMKLRFAAPAHVVDINPISGLDAIEATAARSAAAWPTPTPRATSRPRRWPWASSSWPAPPLAASA
jgi:carbon-monoxide dehydrogenase medium subunit